jgi:hypothetical protein
MPWSISKLLALENEPYPPVLKAGSSGKLIFLNLFVEEFSIKEMLSMNFIV